MAAFNFLSMITRVYNIAFPTTRNVYESCDNLSLDLWVQIRIRCRFANFPGFEPTPHDKLSHYIGTC